MVETKLLFVDDLRLIADAQISLTFVEHQLGALTHLINSDGESSPTQAGHSGGSPALTLTQAGRSGEGARL